MSFDELLDCPDCGDELCLGCGTGCGCEPCACDAPDQAEATMPHVTHWTPEEEDQPACNADVDAPEDAALWGTLNPDRVTCPDCVTAMAAKAATLPP